MAERLDKKTQLEKKLAEEEARLANLEGEKQQRMTEGGELVKEGKGVEKIEEKNGALEISFVRKLDETKGKPQQAKAEEETTSETLVEDTAEIKKLKLIAEIKAQMEKNDKIISDAENVLKEITDEFEKRQKVKKEETKKNTTASRQEDTENKKEKIIDLSTNQERVKEWGEIPPYESEPYGYLSTPSKDGSTDLTWINKTLKPTASLFRIHQLKNNPNKFVVFFLSGDQDAVSSSVNYPDTFIYPIFGNINATNNKAIDLTNVRPAIMHKEGNILKLEKMGIIYYKAHNNDNEGEELSKF